MLSLSQDLDFPEDWIHICNLALCVACVSFYELGSVVWDREEEELLELRDQHSHVVMVLSREGSRYHTCPAWASWG